MEGRKEEGGKGKDELHPTLIKALVCYLASNLIYHMIPGFYNKHYPLSRDETNANETRVCV